MKSEYTVKISLTEHEHDNLQNPYYWCIMKFDKAWHQIAFGWEISPQECLCAALDYYNHICV